MPQNMGSFKGDRNAGKLAQQEADQKTSSVGSDGSTRAGKSDAKPTEQAESMGQECFRCGGTDHLVRYCKAQLTCINCGFNHLSERCVMLNRPHPVLKMAGCGADGLQMMIFPNKEEEKV